MVGVTEAGRRRGSRATGNVVGAADRLLGAGQDDVRFPTALR